MGLSHRVCMRLHKISEKRRMSILPCQAMHRQRKEPRKYTCYGVALFFYALSVLLHVRLLPKGTEALLMIPPIFLAMLSVARILMCVDLEEVHSLLTDMSLWVWIFDGITLKITKFFTGVEKLLLKLKNLCMFMNQLVFFSLCESFCMPRRTATSLYTLMFFNVLAYCISYIKELIEREDWSMYVTIARGSNVRHLAMTATKIILEWTKAIAFIITLVFILIVFGLGKGLKNYEPTTTYLIVTGLYYLVTEKVFVELICKVLYRLKIGLFEDLENLYIPFTVKCIQIILSMFAIAISYAVNLTHLTVFALFINVRLSYKQMDTTYFQPLRKELVSMNKFRPARKEELKEHDDVCAICLAPMKTARITPCYHFFHSKCLRRSLKETAPCCPLCKQECPKI